MLKRWVPWPRAIRWLAGVVVVVLALAIVWVLFVPLADWLAHHDVGSVGERCARRRWTRVGQAADARRGPVRRRGSGLHRAELTLSREGQVTDRYTKAVEQLGSDKIDVRIGGNYALERVARDSARDHPTVMAVLTAFIREHSHEQWPVPERHTDPAAPRATRPDVQAALTVVGAGMKRTSALLT